MDSIILIYLIAVPLLMIQGAGNIRNFPDDIAHFNEMANRNEKINDELELLKGDDGFIAEGSYGFFWRVKYNDKTIALKNVPFKYGLSATRELRNYGDLDAVKNSGSERFGIPNIIYSGETKDERYYLLGMRLLNPIHTRFNVDWASRGKPISDTEAINILVLFKQAVVELKYAHAHGVRHYDLKPDNFLLDIFQSFLTDWNSGERNKDIKPTRPYNGQPHIYATRRGLMRSQRNFRDDIENLYNAFIEFAKLIHLWENVPDGSNLVEYYLATRNNEKAMRKQIETIKHEQLKKFYIEFYEEAYLYPERDIPEYDHMVKIANYHLKQITGSNEPDKIQFQWLTEEQLAKALAFNWPKIEEIPKPSYGSPSLGPSSQRKATSSRPIPASGSSTAARGSSQKRDRSSEEETEKPKKPKHDVDMQEGGK